MEQTYYSLVPSSEGSRWCGFACSSPSAMVYHGAGRKRKKKKV